MSEPHKRSQRQERKGAVKYGGYRQSGSGNGWANKNDVRAPGLSIEYKYTDKKSYSLKAPELEQGEENALLDGGRDFALFVELNGREWVVTSRDYWEEHRGYPDATPTT